MKLKTERVLMVGGLIALTSLMWGELFPAKGSLLKEEDGKKELTAAMMKMKATFTGRMDPFRITPFVDPQVKASDKHEQEATQNTVPVDLVLEAVLLDGPFRAAVLNRQVFLEGETHVLQENGAPITLLRISADRVVVRRGPVELTVTLMTEASKTPPEDPKKTTETQPGDAQVALPTP